MSDETNANKGATIDDALSGGVEDSPVMDALNEEIYEDTVESIVSDESEYGDYDDTDITDILNVGEEEYPKAKEAPEEEVVLSKSQYEALMARLEGEATQALGETAVERPAEIAEQPPVVPVSTDPVTTPLDWEEFSSLITDPESFSNYMAQYAQRVQQQAIASITPLVHSTVNAVAVANRFEKEFYDKHPHMREYPNQAVKALAQAQFDFAKQGKEPSYEELFTATEKNLEYVLKIKRNIEKSAQRRDVRGRSVPKVGPRTTHAGQPKAKVDPTTEAMNDIYALNQSPGGDLLSAIGAF